MTNRIKNLILGLVCLLLFGGCSSIAEGITRGLMGDPDKEKEDTRSCDVHGHSFRGLKPYIVRQEEYLSGGGDPETRPTLKVLMIHGIGDHHTGYSTRFSTNLTREMKLDVKEETAKRIDLEFTPLGIEQPMGHVTVSRYFNKDRTRELLFYELVWSNIIAEEKSLINYDNSGTYTYKRAAINNILKGFINSHAPDPLIYLGKAQEPILRSVAQSLCWMFASDWKDLANYQKSDCDATQRTDLARGLEKDDFAVVTHSLGSRIVIDSLAAVALQSQGGSYGAIQEDLRDYPNVRQLLAALQKEKLPIFMLANQLPLLQLGRDDPEVTRQIEEYCTPEGPNYHKRLFKELKITAFSDPNDILSYEITPLFAHNRMDSRLCPRMTNVSINIANLINIFGVGEAANPGEAHSGYGGDERVVKLIVHGIGHEGASDLIKERCTMMEIIDERSK